mmetsp:Transcript_35842/g.117953  ORF Transcript_35842/g.117953 Transcript_35842/m.117953 type:complete len:219 (-) Transcript_35842:100-756(-)
MATTVVPVGKVEVMHRIGQRIPAGWAVDRSGRDTTDPAEERDHARSREIARGQTTRGGAARRAPPARRRRGDGGLQGVRPRHARRAAQRGAAGLRRRRPRSTAVDTLPRAAERVRPLLRRPRPEALHTWLWGTAARVPGGDALPARRRALPWRPREGVRGGGASARRGAARRHRHGTQGAGRTLRRRDAARVRRARRVAEQAVAVRPGLRKLTSLACM